MAEVKIYYVYYEYAYGMFPVAFEIIEITGEFVENPVFTDHQLPPLWRFIPNEESKREHDNKFPAKMCIESTYPTFKKAKRAAKLRLEETAKKTRGLTKEVRSSLKKIKRL